MSWAKSTCMACSGGELASLSSMSRSGAPTRAMPRVRRCAVAMVGVESKVALQADRGVKLAPGCCQGKQCMERAPRH
jgi:hypothetical protein